MALAPGARLGPFEITSLIGAGGMGEVYQARDINLKRAVAIKVLPEALADDPDRLARFRREAEVLASLNHPNIAAIHGLERGAGNLALVMELVEGPTLADHIAQGPVPLDEALRIAQQITDALGAAHDQGIIHRDLKPANIKLRPDGAVKILDFGLAKAIDPAAGRPSAPLSGGRPGPVGIAESPTITSPAFTEAGVILGTAAYMSPEQAKGRAVDKRADIWAFGCVLYEMLAARRAFGGESVSDTLAAVLLAEPDWSRLPSRLPTTVIRLLARTLQKDPAKRLRDIGDAGHAIHDAITGPAEDAVRPRVDRRPLMNRVLIPALVAATGLAGSIAIWMALATGTPTTTKLIMGWRGVPPRGDAHVAQAPDGSRLAYVGQDGHVWVRELADLEPRVLAGTEGASLAFFSPDSQSIAFVTRPEGALKVASLQSGSVRILVPRQVDWRGGDWASDGTLYFSRPTEGIWKVASGGGETQAVSRPDQVGVTHIWVDVLPSRKGAALLTILRGSASNSEIGVLDLATGTVRSLFPGVQARFATSGHVVYVTVDGRLHAVPFDQHALTLTGSPLPLIENVAVALPDSIAFFTVSEHGTLVYEIQPEPQDELVWVTRGGVVERMGLESWVGNFDSLSLSPDAKRVAVSRTVGPRRDVWTRSLETGATSRLTFDKDGSLNYRAKWTADGRDLSFISNRSGTAGDLWRQTADGHGPAERLVSDGPIVDEGFISPDARWAVYRAGGSGLRGRDIKGVRLGPNEDRTPHSFVATEAEEYGPALSPDGRWLAYVSTESGRPEVYVRPFPEAQRAAWQVSPDGGRGPLWARSGAELFFENRSGELAAVDIRPDATFTWTPPRRLFSLAGFKLNPWQPTYDISPDGARFLMVRPMGASQRSIVLTLNWFQELRQQFADQR